MADDSRDDVDNEITRIVRRPGPAQLPVNVVRPLNAPPLAGSDASAIAPPPAVAAANDSAPPVVPPGAFDRPRPVMTPPPRPSAPPLGAIPSPPAPPSANGPTPIFVRPSPPVPQEARPAPASLPIIAPAPAPSPERFASPSAEAVLPTPVATPAPAPAPMPVPVGAEAPKPATPATPTAVASQIAASVAAVKADVITPAPIEPVVGWLVVVKGPGRGTAREIVNGRNGIGTASGQAVRLDFGDAAISAQGHAYVVYDDEAREFVVEDGKQKIVVRLNGKLLTETMPIGHGDELRIGATTLRFVALCGPDFDWGDDERKAAEASKAAEVAKDVVAPAEAEDKSEAAEG